MNRLRDGVAHPGDGANDVRAWAQMRDLPQEFERVRLRLDRIAIRIIDPTDDFDSAGLHLERLTLGRRWHDGADRLDCTAGGEVQYFFVIVDERIGHDDLHRMKGGAVGQMHKRNAGLGIPARAHPTPDDDRCFPGRATRKNVRATKNRHKEAPSGRMSMRATKRRRSAHDAFLDASHALCQTSRCCATQHRAA